MDESTNRKMFERAESENRRDSKLKKATAASAMYFKRALDLAVLSMVLAIPCKFAHKKALSKESRILYSRLF